MEPNALELTLVRLEGKVDNISAELIGLINRLGHNETGYFPRSEERLVWARQDRDLTDIKDRVDDMDKDKDTEHRDIYNKMWGLVSGLLLLALGWLYNLLTLKGVLR